jgi:septum formation protein
MTHILLASASPRRRELLAALVPTFDVEAMDVPEPLTGDPQSDARSLAAVKARAGLLRHSDALVIGADTIVFDDERSYGKPRDEAHAIAMWHALRGRTHHVVTGVALASLQGLGAAASLSDVDLSQLDDRAVEAYVRGRRPLDKAGAYAIQDEDIPVVRALRGCYCGVMGLPLWETRALLEEAGVQCADPSAAFSRCAICPERPVAPPAGS